MLRHTASHSGSRHDEELVRALRPHHVVDVQQLRDAELLLRHREGQRAVPGTHSLIPLSLVPSK